MKVLKVIGIIILVLVVLFFIIGFFLPSDVHVEREKVFNAQPQVVFEQVNTVRNWENWSAWNQMANDMQTSYNDTASGEGAGYSWTSETMGSGTLTITRSIPYELIKTNIDFQEQGTATGTWQFSPVDGGTKVVWALDADMRSGVFDRWMGVFMDMMVGPSFEDGLNNMERQIQNMSTPTNTSSVPDSDVKAKSVQ